MITPNDEARLVAAYQLLMTDPLPLDFIKITNMILTVVDILHMSKPFPCGCYERQLVLGLEDDVI